MIRAGCVLFVACGTPSVDRAAERPSTIHLGSGVTRSSSSSGPAPVTPACRAACANAVALQSEVIEKARYSGWESLLAARERYVASCTAGCAHFDVTCAAAAKTALDLISCTPHDQPVLLNEMMSDIFPIAPWLSAPQAELTLDLHGFGQIAKVTLPKDLTRRFDVPNGWEAPGDWMSPLSFEIETRSGQPSIESLREQLRDGRDLIATDTAGRVTLVRLRADGRAIQAVVTTAAGSQTVVCHAFATRTAGFDDPDRVAELLAATCGSVRFVPTGRRD